MAWNVLIYLNHYIPSPCLSFCLNLLVKERAIGVFISLLAFLKLFTILKWKRFLFCFSLCSCVSLNIFAPTISIFKFILPLLDCWHLFVLQVQGKRYKCVLIFVKFFLRFYSHNMINSNKFFYCWFLLQDKSYNFAWIEKITGMTLKLLWFSLLFKCQ